MSQSWTTGFKIFFTSTFNVQNKAIKLRLKFQKMWVYITLKDPDLALLEKNVSRNFIQKCSVI